MKLKQQFNIYLFPALLVIFYVTEAFGKFSIVFIGEKSMIQSIVKLIVLISLITISFYQKKKTYYLIVLSIFFLIGQAFLENGFNVDILILFTKFIFVIVLIKYVNEITTKDHRFSNLFFTAFEIVFILNSIFIILGYLFEISLFRTYTGERFGYNGLFIISATGSYAYITAVFYFLFIYKGAFFKKWKTYMILIACILMGTKSIYVSIIGVFICYFLFYVSLPKRFKNVLLIGIILFCCLVGGSYFFYFGKFNEIRQAHGLVSSVLSYRDQLLVNRLLPFINDSWSFINYLFGGISDSTIRSQLGFIDLFFFLGIVGGMYYLFLYYKNYITFKLNEGALVFVLILMLVVFLSGNFFENASVAIYLLVIREKILESEIRMNE